MTAKIQVVLLLGWATFFALIAFLIADVNTVVSAVAYLLAAVGYLSAAVRMYISGIGTTY